MCIYKTPPTVASHCKDVVILMVCDDDAAPLITTRIKYDGFAKKGWFCIK